MDEVDEQNDQDNEDVDDQNGDVESEDEDMEDDDPRLFHVDYDNYYYREGFKIDCELVDRNDPNIHGLHYKFMTFIILNDSRAVQLGKALVGNTKLNYLRVGFTERAGFTSRGAKAFVGGVLGSEISTLGLVGNEEPPMEISQLCWAQSIRDISLHFPMGDEFAIQVSESLAASKSLYRISIRVDQMTPRGAQALSKFLRTSSITTLEFTVPEDTYVRPSVMETLYLEGVSHCRGIRELYLENTVDDMDALATTLSKLHELYIERVDTIHLWEIELLAQGLSVANQLHTLSLVQCGLDREHMSALSPVLGNHSSIKSVTLEHNPLDDAGIAAFVEHWHPESKIEELRLCLTDIGAKGAELLIEASSNHPTLCSLDLSNNSAIEFDGLKLIGEALPNAKIRTLGIYGVVMWSKYEDGNCDEAVIQEAKCVAAGRALLEGVRGNRHLKFLRLSERSHLPATVMEEIDLYVKANVLGRREVLQQSHALPCGLWSHFFAKRGMTSSLVFLFLRELPGVVLGGSRNHTIGRKRRRL